MSKDFRHNDKNTYIYEGSNITGKLNLKDFIGSHFRIPACFVYLDISAAVSSVLLYLINSLLFKHLLHFPFLSFYFNDIMGGALFIACLNLLFCWFGVIEHLLRKFHVIVLVLLAAGVGWEYLTPLYKESTSDPYDLIAYQAGGFIYFTGYLITRRFCSGTSAVQK